MLGAIVLGRPILAWLSSSGVRQNVSADAPARHSAKQGTPTMGGVILLAGSCLGLAALWAMRGVTAQGALVAALVLGSAGIGALDDRKSLRRGTNMGLRARDKFGLQVALTGAFLWGVAATGPPDASVVLGLNLGYAYWLAAALFVLGLSSATNLADGLDGLTAGCSAISYVALAVMLKLAGADDSLVAMAAAMAGGCSGLLWFGAHPALVFMGDTGSLALGAGLAGLAVVGKVEAALALATAVFWAEALSVIAQVGVFKWRKRRYGIEYARAHRLLRRAPLHHALEEAGMPETRIVARFWLAAALSAALAVAWCRHLVGQG
jgi:phospho-N-acetylmuramoyl-pentapeptide-transferase